MQHSHTRILLLSLVLAIIAAVLVPTAPVRAADRSFTLIGDNVGGWGSSVSNIDNPGPTLNVDQGDSLTLTLNATDGEPHTWFIDYDGDSVVDTGEPTSAQFEGDTPITYTFTASRAGTFTYRCSFHPATMTGTINVAAPPSGDNTLLIVGGVVVAVVIVAATAVVMMRRKPKQPAQPPSQP